MSEIPSAPSNDSPKNMPKSPTNRLIQISIPLEDEPVKKAPLTPEQRKENKRVIKGKL